MINGIPDLCALDAKNKHIRTYIHSGCDSKYLWILPNVLWPLVEQHWFTWNCLRALWALCPLYMYVAQKSSQPWLTAPPSSSLTLLLQFLMPRSKDVEPQSWIQPLEWFLGIRCGLWDWWAQPGRHRSCSNYMAAGPLPQGHLPIVLCSWIPL